MNGWMRRIGLFDMLLRWAAVFDLRGPRDVGGQRRGQPMEVLPANG